MRLTHRTTDLKQKTTKSETHLAMRLASTFNFHSSSFLLSSCGTKRTQWHSTNQCIQYRSRKNWWPIVGSRTQKNNELKK